MPTEAAATPVWDCLVGKKKEKNRCPVALAYTELPHHHQLLRDSAACPRIGVFVCVHVHISARIPVCGHNMLWVDL